MESKNYNYNVYGLNIASSFPVTELGPETSGDPDITIEFGEVPNELPLPSANGIAWQAEPGKALLTVDEVAKYLVLDDKKILIQPYPGSNETDVRLFLLGSVLGAVLHGQKLLVLHSSVINTKRGAVLFLGDSGAGKSTTLGAFVKRGYSMVSDDKACVAFDEKGVARVMPGFPSMRLTQESVDNLNFPVNGASPSPGLGKYVLPVERFSKDPVPIYAAYSLMPHNRNEIEFIRFNQFHRFRVLVKHTYRRRFLHDDERRKAHFRSVTALSEQIRVTKINRPIDVGRIDEMVDRIEEDFTQ